MGLQDRYAPVALHPWSLVFAGQMHELENGFRRHQSTAWTSNELRNVYLNLFCGVMNLSITTFLVQKQKGSMFTLLGAKVMLPYLSVAVVHWYLAAHWSKWPRCRASANLAFEACYSIICTLSMPSWVLHGTAADAKTFLRVFILGSGVLIGYWCRFLTPTFFCKARWIIPLQFLFQAWQLTGPTCAAIQASEYGAEAAAKLSRSLDWLAGITLGSCPAVHSCHNLVYMLEFVAGALLCYVHYRIESSSRVAFLQGKAALQPYWPCMPGYVQVVLHFAVSVLLCSFVWVLLQCSRTPT